MPKYVVDMHNNGGDDTIVLRNADDLFEFVDYDITLQSPCYVTRIGNVGFEPDELDIEDVIGLLFCDQTEDIQELLQFSVRSDEPRYNDWLIAAEKFVGATVTIVNRKKYSCALINVPTAKHFNNED
jgi:hypothetical protein